MKSLPPIVFPRTNAPATTDSNGPNQSQDTKQQLSNAVGAIALEAAIRDAADDTSYGHLQVNRGGSTSSASVPPSPKTNNSGVSPTPSIASFTSYHTPVRSKKKSPRKSKKKAGNSTFDLNFEDGHLGPPPSPPGGAGQQQDKHNSPKGNGAGRSYSPNVLKRFQAVKSGLSFVNHLKFDKPQ